MSNQQIPQPPYASSFNQTYQTSRDTNPTPINPNLNSKYLGSVTNTYSGNQNISNMRVSHLYEHNAYQETDKLYEPLRGIILYPQSTVFKHQKYIPDGARVSHVSHQYHNLSPQQLSKMKDNTWIPADVHLVPTNHLEKVKNSKFMVVDTQERIIGQPVSERQIDMIRRRGLKQQKIVYDFGGQNRIDFYGSQKSEQSVKQEVVIRQGEIINKVVEERPPKYRTTPVLDIEDKPDYKYNLYSVIDEPMNRLREGNSCTCPGNQIIAQRNQPQSISWIK